jgi:hypothetical protein
VFDRDCGATTGFSTQLSILDTDDKLPDDGGNTLVPGDKDKITSVRWESPTKLSVQFMTGAEVFSQDSHERPEPGWRCRWNCGEAWEKRGGVRRRCGGESPPVALRSAL